MTGITPPEVVRGVARVPLPFGLFSILVPRTGDRWEGGGITWETLTCEAVGAFGAPDCDDPPTGMEGGKDLEAMSAPMESATPFTVYGHHTCSPIGNTFEWAFDRAQDHLERREEARIEQALWTGDLGNVPNFTGSNGYSAPSSKGSTTDLVEAVAILEQEFAEAYGSQGLLHMSRKNALILLDSGTLKARNGRLTTALETPVVAGTGYGSGKIVASSLLVAYQSDIFPGDLGSAGLDLSNNDFTALAERSWVIGFDSCGLLEVTLSSDEVQS